MALPILGAIAVAAGIALHNDAKNDNKMAEEITKDAERLYRNSYADLQYAELDANQALRKLDSTKNGIREHSMKRFCEVFSRMDFKSIMETKAVKELEVFQPDFIKKFPLEPVSEDNLPVLVAGVAGGGVALAASEILGGGVAVAEVLGMAAPIGVAANPLFMPLARFAAPVAFAAAVAENMKAFSNRENANEYYKQAECASQQMEQMKVGCNGIMKETKLLDDNLMKLDKLFAKCLDETAMLVYRRQAYGRKLKSSDFSEQELGIIGVTYSIACAIKTILDKPINLKELTDTQQSLHACNEIGKSLPDYERQVAMLGIDEIAVF